MSDKYEIVFRPKGGFWASTYKYEIWKNGNGVVKTDFLWDARRYIRKAIRKKEAQKGGIIETWQG